MRSLLAAIAFLTIIPVPQRSLDPQQDYSRCAVYFPIVGILIGGLGGLAAWLLMGWLPPLSAAVLLVAALTWISGGLHLDGLADTADGFLSGRPRERVLEIMRDSRIGTMGVVAVLLVVLLKISLISDAIDMKLSLLPAVIASMAFAGRCSLIWGMWMNRYVRESGLGHAFWMRSGSLSAIVFAALTAASYAALGYRGALAVFVSFAVTTAFSRWCRRRIGGATGDTLGACCELTEAAFLLFAVCLEGEL